jgi:hypothetical protein
VEIACPACGKTNDLNRAPACARCGCELGHLAQTLAGAASHLSAATRALRAQEWLEVRRHAQRSWSLRHTPQAAQLAALAAVATGEAQDFLRWRERASVSGAT